MALYTDLTSSELYEEAPAIALQLWKTGFRPCKACDLRPKQVIVYFQTDVFGMYGHAPAESAIIKWVKYNEEMGEVTVYHTAGVTEADDGQEVWVK